MPLRSVEAATRDDAIAAAREQFGPSARVVGVRRVRSGGVLGFFATERYVAEVAPDVTNRPPSPPSPRPTRRTTRPADFSSPLASAAPARARAAAPARNGAAAWAAEARPSTSRGPGARVVHAASPPPRAAASVVASPPPTAAARRQATGDDERVSELAVPARRQAGRAGHTRLRPASAFTARLVPPHGRRRPTSRPPGAARTSASRPADVAPRPRPSPPRSRGWWPGTATSGRRSRKHSSDPERRAAPRASAGPARANCRVSGAAPRRARRRKRWEIRSSRPPRA